MRRDIYYGSRISRLPSWLSRPAVVCREFLSALSFLSYPYHNDGVASRHNFQFLKDPTFITAKQRTIESVGLDYRIDLRLHQATWSVERAIQLDPNCNLVELGTGKGFTMLFVAQYLKEKFGDCKNSFFLIDTFVPFLPDSKGTQSSNNVVSNVYAANYEETAGRFVAFRNVSLLEGELPSVLDSVKLKRIGFLHIDLNSPEIEVACLERLWNELIPGGVVLIDDYAYEGNVKTNELFNEVAKKLKRNILTTASGQGILFK